MLKLFSRLVDLVEDAAVGEMDLLRLGPAAEHLVDREERQLREALGVSPGDLGRARPEIVARDELLAFRRIEMLEIFLGDRARAAAVDRLVDDRDRRLGEDADRRRDDLDLVLAELVDRQEGLVLPSDQAVALAALDEGQSSAARAAVEHRHVGEELADEFLRLR